MRYAVAFSLLVITLGSCQPVNHGSGEEKDKLSQLSWMLGKWEMQTPEGVITEEWVKPSDTQWQGTSYMITADGDTPFHESITLDYEDDTLYYQPVVRDQNEGVGVSFTEKQLSDNEITFENLRHDFPQRIIYKRTSDSTIVAAIEGNKDGQLKREEFSYVKSRR